jgi:acetyl-CoA decarbonylase/synthase complex subunit gamma
MIKSRMSAFRMNYAVAPGLYAVGEPTKDSDVFVTANYKLSFDILRRSLQGMNAWLLVLDTKSINVWCAAGKGTFGTDELVKRIKEARLDAVVGHRRIILPQLGAVGVNASAVQKQTGFRVSFGPVQAGDIPAYIRGGYKKTKEMSTIGFSMLDRLVLTPMEINPAMKKFPWFAAGVLLLFGLQPSGLLFKQAWFGGLPFLLLGLIAVFAGAFVTPVLLPFVPFRSFAIKGWIVGMLSVALAVRALGIVDGHATIMLAATYLLFPAMSSYLALQFTGSTTFTGMSGVKKELRIGIPLYIGTAGISGLLMVLFKLREWGII